MTGFLPPMPWTLGAAWGVIIALPFVRSGRRVVTTTRVAALAVHERAPVPTRTGGWRYLKARLAASVAAVRAGSVGRVLGSLFRRRRENAAATQLAPELPVVTDLLAVAVGSGCTPFLAVEVAARWSPPVAAHRLDAVMRACGMGVGFDDALAHEARTTPALRPLCDALLASERLGAPVGPALARLAAEERTALRRRAEAHARRVPVRLLFPLVFLVLPAFVLLTVVPGLVAGLNRL